MDTITKPLTDDCIMESITKPLTEEEILAATSIGATGEQIRMDMETKAQYCVDHLCGCG